MNQSAAPHLECLDADHVETMTNVEATGVKAQARALAAARTRQVESDAVSVAGDAMDRHGVPLLRLLLSTAALVIIYVDPADPDRHVPFTYAALTLYAVYSAVVYIAASAQYRAIPKGAAHWTDVAWHTVLVSLSSGTNSLFFSFYFFDILVASFRCGRAEGHRVTIAATALFTSVGYASAPAETFELNRFLLRSVSLLGLGYMIAYWGGLEARLKQRLALLKEVTALSNPRFGVHQTIASSLEKLRAFYHADACLMVIADAVGREHWLYQARAGQADAISNPERCAPEMAAMLFTIPWNQALVVDRGRFAPLRGPSVYVEDGVSGRSLRELPSVVNAVVSALDTEAIATLPFRYHHDAIGRLYVTGRSGTFDVSDLDFLSHAVDAMLRVTENVRLVDRLASEAADNERRRIARGIHDTVIQPYIGLQLGLCAIVQRVKEGDRQVEEDLTQLLGLIEAEVSRLRHYVTDLKGMPDSRLSFMSALRRYTRQFEQVTGIDVHVDGPAELALTERVAAELFEMATEALSNVRRHTAAQHVAIGVERRSDTACLSIENDGVALEAPPFDPRSLGEHAEAMGGTLDVRRSPGAATVRIRIPL